MLVSYESFSLPKAGNALEEYEDAFWPLSSVEKWSLLEHPVLRFAIADGATETSFSGSWARALCELYCGVPNDQNADIVFWEGLGTLQQQWKETVGAKPLPWYAEEKARSGAFSSLLGITLSHSATADEAAPLSRKTAQNIGQTERPSSASFEALAVGDSCLFHVRNESLLEAFPLEHAADFNNSPFLIGSVPRSQDKTQEHVRGIEGHCNAGDVLYLMTDALAAWLLSLYETEGDDGVFAYLSHIHTQEAFQQLVQEERSGRDENGRPRLRNDDVTMIRVTVGSKVPSQLLERQ